MSSCSAASSTRWPRIARTSLLEPALGTIHELFACYETMSFGLVAEDFLEFAMGQFQARLARIERSRVAGVAGWEPEEG
jgi:hypothetical protein